MTGKKLIKIAAIVCALAIMVTVGVAVFAADEAPEAEGSKSAIWDILTDEQKAQLAADAKARLDQALADGRITQEQYDAGIAAIESGERPFFGKGGFKGGRGGMMNQEQSAAMEEIISKWDALTDEQKEEIYGLNDQKTAIDSQIIDKYVEFGLIDAEAAAEMKENLENRRSDMRSNGRMPMFGGKGMGGQRGMRGQRGIGGQGGMMGGRFPNCPLQDNADEVPETRTGV